jgi:GNAT superfamily N-acetyltransferase
MTSSKVEVSRLSPADWEVLQDLRLRALKEAPDALLGDLAREAHRSPAEWMAFAFRHDWFAATLGGDPAGVASSLIDPATQDRFVESMWVHPRYRGVGVARHLLRAIEELVLNEGRRRIRLWVLEGNESAAALYRRYGFLETPTSQVVPGHPGLREIQFVVELRSRTGAESLGVTTLFAERR